VSSVGQAGWLGDFVNGLGQSAEECNPKTRIGIKP
jgi:hypothetical protein